MGTHGDTADEQMAAAKDWLWSEGLRRAELLLRRNRLRAERKGLSGYDAEDLAAATLEDFCRHVKRHGAFEDLDVGGYCYRVMERRLSMTLRGRPRWAPVLFDDGHKANQAEMSSIGAADGALFGAVRGEIEQADAPDWARAGALTFAAVHAEPHLVPADHSAPRPGQGAAPEEKPKWLALWFAGRRDGRFGPDGKGGEASVRQNRSRDARVVVKVFEQAGAAAVARALLDDDAEWS